MLPYILLADQDSDACDSFVEELDKRIAYAAVQTVEDGQKLLTFLANRSWKDLPSMILVNYELPDAKAPDLLRELLTDTRYLTIPKLVWSCTGHKKEMEECRMLGVKRYLHKPNGVFEIEDVVRQIDDILKAELSIV
ncbi:MAG TPA: response regulator [Puia sp.]|nr:response regulator [Puia sp.]